MFLLRRSSACGVGEGVVAAGLLGCTLFDVALVLVGSRMRPPCSIVVILQELCCTITEDKTSVTMKTVVLSMPFSFSQNCLQYMVTA